jgi:transposase
VGKPKDKAKVEAAVLLVTRWITAALRNHTFFSLEELNAKIRELLERLNNRKFKKLDTTRKELFEALDKPALKPLPLNRYECAQWEKATVNIDYHIEVEGHYYSVPYQLVKKHVEVRIAAQSIEVLYSGKRVAIHPRSFQKGKSTTINEHRPKAHQKYLEWTPQGIINWARQTGPATAELVDMIMVTKPHPEQGYRSCLGIITLENKFSTQRIENAAKRALLIKSYSYKSVKSILESGLDSVALVEQQPLPTVNHDNIRGHDYYN